MADWWCAGDHAQELRNSSAVQSDSCFCIIQKSMTQQEAFNNCTTHGGFLADIQNDGENAIVGNLLDSIKTTDQYST